MNTSSNAPDTAKIVDCDHYRDLLLEEEAENLLYGMMPGGRAGAPHQ